MPKRKLEELLEYLDENEMEVYTYYKVTSKKIEFLVGRILLKKIIALKKSILPQNISFSKDTYGKLYFDRFCNSSIYFNLSHTEGVVCALFSPYEFAGIDVEKVKLIDYTDIILRVFKRSEIDYIYSKSDKYDRLNAFYHVWTRKEAILKAYGLGFYMNPLGVEVVSGQMGGIPQNHFFETVKLSTNYIASIAIYKDNLQDIAINIYETNLEELIYR